MSGLLLTAARYGRWTLILGLLAGAFLPSLAAIVKPHIGWMIALLLLTSCVRIGYTNAVGVLREIRQHFAFALVLQLLSPLLFVMILWGTGLAGSLWIALILMLMGSPIAGSPNLAIMMGADPAPALRQLVIGTAILPFTALPVLALVPEFGGLAAVALSAAKLMAIILGAAVAGFAIRAVLMKTPNDEDLQKVDGISAILMAVVVIGLMSAVGNYLYSDPAKLLGMLAIVCAANFAAQLIFGWGASRFANRDTATAVGIVGGNRNMALFLTALPASTTDPLLLFIGCYQIPMYLTPLVMQRFYQRGDKR